MRQQYRYGVALAAVALIGGTTACSSDSEATATESNKIAVIVASTKQTYGQEMMAGYTAGATQVGGVEVAAVGTDIIDGPKQVAMFEDATKTHSGGLTVFTITPDLFAEPFAAAGQAGIPLIALDTPAAPSSNVKLLVSNDNIELGRQLADTVAARLPASTKGTIVVGTKSPGAQILDERAAGMREQFKKTMPNVTVLGPFDTKQDEGENMASWRLLVRTNPKALAFLGTGDNDSIHLAQIRKATKGTWLAGGFTTEPAALTAVKQGHLLLVSPEHYTEGLLAGRLQAQRVTGSKLPEGWIYIPGIVITKENVDAVILRQVSDASRAEWSTKATDDILADLPTYLRPLSALD